MFFHKKRGTKDEQCSSFVRLRRVRRGKKLIIILIVSIVIAYCTLLLLDIFYPPKISRAHNFSQVVTDKDGKWLRVYLTDDDKYRFSADVGDLPKDYLKLLLNYEDKSFYQHNGIDFSAALRALWQNVTSQRVVSGASTLSMQTARLLMPQPRTLRGKIVQAFRAWQLERRFSKQEILSMYISLTPVGGNREGLTSASHYYLNKPTKMLSLSESAWLIALSQSPKKLSKNVKSATIAKNKVLHRAFTDNVIDKNQYEQAIKEPLVLVNTPFPKHAMHISDYSRKKDKRISVIRTAISKSLQVSLESLLRNQLPQLQENSNLAGGILSNRTGQWLAYVGSADFFNNARKGHVDMLNAIRSPGSALKSFITLYAFDWLYYTPETTIDDMPLSSAYRPSNYDGLYSGRISLSQALKTSRNVPAVTLLQNIKPHYFISILQKHGLHFYLPRGAQPNLSLALGGVGIRGGNLAKTYMKLANCTFKKDESLAQQISCQQVSSILQKSHNDNGRIFFGNEPVAFKTGTSYGWRDRWIFAYTQKYTIVLWSGRADGQFSENKASAEELIPLLRQVVGILPDPPKKYPQMAIIQRTNAELPKRLRHVFSDKKQSATLSPDNPSSLSQSSHSLTVLSPLPESTIEYRSDMALNIRINGGTPPYIYVLNDSIVNETTDHHINIKKPKPGNYLLHVIDIQGNSVKSNFRLEKRQEKNAYNGAVQTVNWKHQIK